MLVFFATWCPHCNEEAPTLSELQGEYEDLRIIMLGIDDQDDPALVREFVDSYGIESPAAYDPSLGPVYQVSGYPTIYVVNGNQEIVAAHSGEIPKGVLESWVEEALANGR
jgi:thiol-disulfide isomerase/thioredoxin